MKKNFLIDLQKRTSYANVLAYYTGYEDGSFIQCFAIEVDGGVCLTYEDSGAPDEEDVVALDYFETLEEASAFFEQMMDQPLTYARRTNES